jgi:hypothetical protein
MSAEIQTFVSTTTRIALIACGCPLGPVLVPIGGDLSLDLVRAQIWWHVCPKASNHLRQALLPGTARLSSVLEVHVDCSSNDFIQSQTLFIGNPLERSNAFVIKGNA